MECTELQKCLTVGNNLYPAPLKLRPYDATEIRLSLLLLLSSVRFTKAGAMFNADVAVLVRASFSPSLSIVVMLLHQSRSLELSLRYQC